MKLINVRILEGILRYYQIYLYKYVDFSNVQCFIDNDKFKFGSAQAPSLLDYPDNLDVISFLIDNFHI